MEILILLLIYAIGVVLALGRGTAMLYEIKEKYMPIIPCKYKTIYDTPSVIVISLMSWMAFVAGILIYFGSNDKYFFKWSYKDLQ